MDTERDTASLLLIHSGQKLISYQAKFWTTDFTTTGAKFVT